MAQRLLSRAKPSVVRGLDTTESAHTTRWRDTFGDAAPLHLLALPGDEAAQDQLRELLAGVEIAVMSPGIPATSELYAFIHSLGVSVTSGSALFVADHRSTLLGVTGSKGKSTTSTLVHHLLSESGVEVSLGGNMGIPLQGLEPAQYHVVEFSSYQCHYLATSPDVVVLTALFPEHLDWHGSVEAYYADKLSILEHGLRVVIAASDDPILRGEITRRYPHLKITWVGHGQEWHLESEGHDSWIMRGDERLFHTGESSVVGTHNHLNMALALAGAAATGLLDESVIASSLASFKPLPNRLEKIHDPSGIVFVNDSLATNPHAAAAALHSLNSPNMVWLVGGTDRGVDYSVLVDQVLRSRPAHILGLPGNGATLVELFRQALDSAPEGSVVHTEVVESMGAAITLARNYAAVGDIVLLSPGAPSFGQYQDYQARADDFRHAIESTTPKENP